MQLNSACRTPICKAKRGGFKDTLADDLLAPVLKVTAVLSLMQQPYENQILYNNFDHNSLTYNIQLQALIQKTNVKPSEVGDIVVGTVLAPGSARAMECRMAAFYAGFPGQYSS